MTCTTVPADARFLLPGEVFFGAQGRVKTLLGSCVAITLWHPVHRLGGMCHYVLPAAARSGADEPPDGRYGDAAVLALLRAAQNAGTRASEYVVGLYGGGRMFPNGVGQDLADIGRRNVEAGLKLLLMHGFVVPQVHAGGCGHRTVTLDLDTGQVSVRHEPLSLDTARR
jgi:chemotaxis protein CheD